MRSLGFEKGCIRLKNQESFTEIGWSPQISEIRSGSETLNKARTFELQKKDKKKIADMGNNKGLSILAWAGQGKK